MNLSEVTVFIYGEEKEEALTAMKRVNRHGKNAALLHFYNGVLLLSGFRF